MRTAVYTLHCLNKCSDSVDSEQLLTLYTLYFMAVRTIELRVLAMCLFNLNTLHGLVASSLRVDAKFDVDFGLEIGTYWEILLPNTGPPNS